MGIINWRGAGAGLGGAMEESGLSILKSTLDEQRQARLAELQAGYASKAQERGFARADTAATLADQRKRAPSIAAGKAMDALNAAAPPDRVISGDSPEGNIGDAIISNKPSGKDRSAAAVKAFLAAGGDASGVTALRDMFKKEHINQAEGSRVVDSDGNVISEAQPKTAAPKTQEELDVLKSHAKYYDAAAKAAGRRSDGSGKVDHKIDEQDKLLFGALSNEVRDLQKDLSKLPPEVATGTPEEQSRWKATKMAELTQAKIRQAVFAERRGLLGDSTAWEFLGMDSPMEASERLLQDPRSGKDAGGAKAISLLRSVYGQYAQEGIDNIEAAFAPGNPGPQDAPAGPGTGYGDEYEKRGLIGVGVKAVKSYVKNQREEKRKLREDKFVGTD